MAQDSFREYVLDKAETDADVDVLDMKRVSPAYACVHHSVSSSDQASELEIRRGKEKEDNSPNFIQILPELKFARVRTYFIQIRCQECLPVPNLRTIFINMLIDRSLITCAPCRKGTSCDVVLEQLLVHDVDYSGDELLDIFGAADQGFDITG